MALSPRHDHGGHGQGFGHDQECVSVTHGTGGRQEILYDFNRIVASGLSRAASVVIA